MTNKRRLILAAMLVILAVSLSGCVKMYMTVSFLQDEQWTTSLDVQIDEETLTDMSSSFGEEVDLSEIESDLDGAVNDLIAEYGDEGVDATWTTFDPELEGWSGYSMVVSGQGYDLLNEVMFDNQAEISVDQDGNINFYAPNMMADLNGEFGDLGDLGDLGEFGEFGALFDFEIVFAIEGANVVDSNGEVPEENSGRVEWRNQGGPFEATVEPQGRGLKFPAWAWFVLGGVCCLGALIVVGGVVFFVVRSRRSKETVPPTPAVPAAPATPAPAAPAPTAKTREAPAAPVAAKDDLTRIEGIGPKLKEVLYAAGITSFSALAETPPDRLTEMIKAGGFKAPFNPGTWAQQARLAAKGDWGALKELQQSLKGGKE